MQIVPYTFGVHQTPATLLVFGGKSIVQQQQQRLDNRKKNLILLCAGWPDDHSCLTPMAEQLVDDTTVTAVACLPGFDSFQNEQPNRTPYSFTDWVDSLQAAVTMLRQQEQHQEQHQEQQQRQPAASQSLTFIFHDWGCLAGMQLVNRMIRQQQQQQKQTNDSLPDKIVLLDVLLQTRGGNANVRAEKESVWTFARRIVSTVIYQLAFATGWFLYRHVHPIVGGCVGPPCIALLRLLQLLPSGSTDSIRITSWKQMNVCMGKLFPYFNLWTRVLGLRNGRHELRGMYTPLKNSKILYLYGIDKNYALHDPQSLAQLQAQPHCRVTACPGGHWFFQHEPEQTLQHIRSFLNES